MGAFGDNFGANFDLGTVTRKTISGDSTNCTEITGDSNTCSSIDSIDDSTTYQSITNDSNI